MADPLILISFKVYEYFIVQLDCELAGWLSLQLYFPSFVDVHYRHLDLAISLEHHPSLCHFNL